MMATGDFGSSTAQRSSKGWNLCPMPWLNNGGGSSSINNGNNSNRGSADRDPNSARHQQNTKQMSLGAIAKASFLVRRRLRFDPDRKLYFIYEPGKQVSSAVRIKNVSRSYVAFKVGGQIFCQEFIHKFFGRLSGEMGFLIWEVSYGLFNSFHETVWLICLRIVV